MEAAASAPPSTVLVVGAGPVGLTAATVLAHHVDAAAARIVVIDAAASPCPPEQSRALVLWRRALQALDPYVPAEAWAANGRGQPMRAALFAEEGAVLGRVDFAPGGEPQQQQHVLPAGMLIKQADVEDVLGGVLAARYNVTVRRSTRLVGLAAADDGSGDLLCELASASGGGSEVLRASHVIGCDGARSTVRKALGVRFSGATLGNQRWLLGDFEYEAAAAADGSVCRRPPPPRPEEAAPSPGCLLLSTSRHGTLGLLPVGAKHGVVRLVWNPPGAPFQALQRTAWQRRQHRSGGRLAAPVAARADVLRACIAANHAATEAPAGEPTMAHFQAALQAGTRMQIRLTRPLWVSEFVINERMVRHSSASAAAARLPCAPCVPHALRVRACAGGQVRAPWRPRAAGRRRRPHPFASRRAGHEHRCAAAGLAAAAFVRPSACAAFGLHLHACMQAGCCCIWCASQACRTRSTSAGRWRSRCRVSWRRPPRSGCWRATSRSDCR